jgi:hypothetical protein
MQPTIAPGAHSYQQWLYYQSRDPAAVRASGRARARPPSAHNRSHGWSVLASGPVSQPRPWRFRYARRIGLIQIDGTQVRAITATP